MESVTNRRAAALAGVVAGLVATVFQLGLWASAAVPLPQTLYRDARLTAAIVLGSAALTPPDSFDWTVMVVASAVHFALSIVYGLVFCTLLARLSPRRSGLWGALFGLLLFFLNLYGMTAFFPWFAVARDWITAAAHVVFGVTLALAYPLPARPGR